MTDPDEKPRKGTLLIDGRPIAEVNFAPLKSARFEPLIVLEHKPRPFVPGRMRFELPIVAAVMGTTLSASSVPIEQSPMLDMGDWGKMPLNRVFRDSKGAYPLLKRNKLREGAAVFIQNARPGRLRRMTVKASRVISGAFYLEDASGMVNLEFKDGWVWTQPEAILPRPEGEG